MAIHTPTEFAVFGLLCLHTKQQLLKGWDKGQGPAAGFCLGPVLFHIGECFGKILKIEQQQNRPAAWEPIIPHRWLVGFIGYGNRAGAGYKLLGDSLSCSNVTRWTVD